MSKSSKISDDQIEQFKQAARELGCDEDESHFEEKLKKVARHKPVPYTASKTAKQKKKRDLA